MFEIGLARRRRVKVVAAGRPPEGRRTAAIPIENKKRLPHNRNRLCHNSGFVTVG